MLLIFSILQLTLIPQDTLASVNLEHTFQAGTKRTAPTLQSTFFREMHFQYFFKHSLLHADVGETSCAVSPAYQRTISTHTSDICFNGLFFCLGK